MHNLTQDQLQALQELKDSDGLKILMLELENMVARIRADVHKVHVGSSPTLDEQQLLYKKLEAQGAERLYKAVVLLFNPPKVKK